MAVLRALILLATLSAPLAAVDAQQIRLRIIAKLAQVVTRQEAPAVFLAKTELLPFNHETTGLNVTDDCQKARVLFTDDIEKLKRRCPLRHDQLIFTFSYRDYIRHEHEAAGAFFWQKGRPNIILNGKLLRQRKIDVPTPFLKYVE